MRDAVILSQEAVRLSQEVVMLLAEDGACPGLEEGAGTIKVLRKQG
jgi:hypothetical protein